MKAASAAALRAEAVSKRFGVVVALDEVSLAVATSECLALVGASGSGKTTLLRCFNRMVVPDGGRIEVNGIAADELNPIELRRHMGYVPQDGGLLPHWRVRRNVALVPMLRGQSTPASMADRALELVGLPANTFAHRWPHELSGGERQRVAIARALASNPEVVLLDEPFGALDAITRAELQDAFRDLRARLAITTVLVTHDLHEAVSLADRIAVLHHGRVEQVATSDVLLSAPATDYVRRLLERARI
ncbi:MAG TPA: ATP-binding cassette domain-containing protein [Gemmatimonadaceae bacterium]|nr:ATP-binding cassette domain-containing protein [Gemmatimonadaceae bacterium]